MKYLAYEQIETLNNQICQIDDGDLKIFSKIEVYSCKSTTTERKLKHLIDKKYEDEFIDIQIISPHSPFGPLSMKTSKKTLFYLVSTLNCSYPDYDFSDTKPDLFQKVPDLSLVVNRINNTLLTHFRDPKKTQQTVWEAIDSVITLQNADIYEFQPQDGMEPDDELGNIWAFYYFFYNRQDKRVLFFTARAVTLMASLEGLGSQDFESSEQLGSGHEVPFIME